MNEDLSGIFEKLNINKDSISPEMINSIMDMINSKSSSSTDETENNNFSTDIDMETILKMKTIMDKMNTRSTNARSKLLYDLKPFLSENKKNKIDQYMKMDRMLELLPLISGDFNTRLYNDDQALLFSLISLLF